MGCTSRAQNLKYRAQNFDLHRSDPQRSGTPNVFRYYADGCYANWFFAPSGFRLGPEK